MEIILYLVLFGLAVGYINEINQHKKTKSALDQAEKQKNRLASDLQSLKEKTQPLWKYQPIHDAQQKANKIMEAAREGFERTKLRAREIIKESRQKTADAKIKADEILNTAANQSEQIITSARQQATEIAGDALVAKEKADLFAKKAQAMKNIIDGYGDEYLISESTLLDELAEDFNHKDAGVELAKARQYTKALIKNKQAAECDYVEDNRKTTAIHFVLDAFNGKVDTAITKLKHDNYGKLEQEIKDALALVNGHGQAFRNARITETYFQARLNELKWGTIVRELQLQEREEQRRIKEEIREEEKARREYEKAIRDAEKEERLIKEAMKEAEARLATATEEQRQQYEQQLAELQAKYEEAEAKNQRALSMAQQTRRGHVYVISNVGSFGENVYKIGLTRRLEPLDRIKELGDASVPFSFDVHAMIYAEDAPALENQLHNHFNETRLNKVNYRKEFFSANLTEIKQEVDKRGLSVHWTMLAEAMEYRESLSIARKAQIENDEEVEYEKIMA